jgi:hypothetical protein
MDIIITLLYLPVLAYLGFHFKRQRIPFLLFVSCLPYFASLAIYYLFPYEYEYPLNHTLVGLTLLGLVSAIAMLGIVFRRGMSSIPENIYPQPWVLVVAYLFPIFLFIEFWLNPFLSIHNSLDVNRMVLEYSSSFYVVGYLMSGASLFLLMFVNLRIRLAVFLFLVFPWLAGSAFGFIVGNRQFFFVGCIVLVFTIFTRVENLARIIRIKYVFWFLLTVVTLYSVQFARDKYQASRQDLNFYNVFNIKPKSDNIVTENYFLNTFCVVLYAYYGIEFCAYSAYVDNEVISNAPLLLNYPLVYKRVLPSGGVERYADLANRNMSERSEALNAFSNIWMTMFGSFFMEYGFASLIGYPLVYLFVIVAFIKYAARNSVNVLYLFVFVCTTVAFGVQYFIFNEHFAYLFLALVLAPKKVTTLVARNTMRPIKAVQVASNASRPVENHAW